jgi:A/G-specific adenine glycosylase
VLDGNVKRVLARLLAIEEPIDLSSTENELWSHAEALLDNEQPGGHNQAMMELGARICTPTSPVCQDCPVSRFCAAAMQQRQSDFPVRTKKRPLPLRRSAVLILRRPSDHALLLRRRSGEEFLARLWEFPMEWVKESESKDEVFRQLADEFLPGNDKGWVFRVKAAHIYTHFRLNATGFLIDLASKDEENLKGSFRFSETTLAENQQGTLHPEYAWLTPANRHRYAIHRAHQKLLEQIENHEILNQ